MEGKRVMFAVSRLKIMTAKHILEQADIVSFTIDKLDSAHGGAFGDIELYVGEDDAAEARAILQAEDII